MILEMIQDLPGHSRLSVRRSLQMEAGEKEDLPAFEGLDEALRYAEARRWNNPEQEMAALTVNALWRLYEAVPQWKDRPEFPTIGPREWWPDKQKAEHAKRVRRENENTSAAGGESGPSVLDAMASLGFGGGR